MTLKEGDLLWTPSKEQVEAANVTVYINWLHDQGIAELADYSELWRWSVDNIEAFWSSIWKYFDIISDAPYTTVTDTLEMKPGGRWFLGSRVNFAEHVFRQRDPERTALYAMSETRPLYEISWGELERKVHILATVMRREGVKPGDTICSLMPNAPETVIAMLATMSIGAVWCNSAPEFGAGTIIDRFKQVDPKWLFLVDAYSYGGKIFNQTEKNQTILDSLSSTLEKVILLPHEDDSGMDDLGRAVIWYELFDGEFDVPTPFVYTRVANDHPLWVLFSSGTTGLPKGIVHSHIGVLVEVLKGATFHMNLRPCDKNFFYTTTGWVMFSMQVAILVSGASAVLYDGNPAWPEPDTLWRMTADVKATGFGASPTYVQYMRNAGIRPGKTFDLSNLTTITCSGSPATPETFEWFYQEVKSDLWLTSQSGGTEVAGGFAAASPTLPVYAGEIQVRGLGMDIDSYDDRGNSIRNEVGELVCKQPFPSMPLHFLGDEDGARYRTTYFDDYPGVWRHGDFLKINDRGGCYIYGRSDATLNRYGVRIGTSELYGIVDCVDEIADSLVVCLELADGKFFMPMFLEMAEGHAFDATIEEALTKLLRHKGSPRHVPDKYIVVPEIPYTLTGKKSEVPVRKILLGWPVEKSLSRESLRTPEAIDAFVDYVATTVDYKVPSQSNAN